LSDSIAPMEKVMVCFPTYCFCETNILPRSEQVDILEARPPARQSDRMPHSSLNNKWLAGAQGKCVSDRDRCFCGSMRRPQPHATLELGIPNRGVGGTEYSTPTSLL